MKSKQLTIHQCECALCQAGSESETARYHRSLNRMLAIAQERQRRLVLGSLSQQPGGPTDDELSQITGISRHTIQKGREELEQGFDGLPVHRQRHPGGGQPAAEKKIRS